MTNIAKLGATLVYKIVMNDGGIIIIIDFFNTCVMRPITKASAPR